MLTLWRAIVDELGRGTSTREGLAIALAIAEALVQSRVSEYPDACSTLTSEEALVWFATHFKDIARILAERSGVVSLHLAVEVRDLLPSRNYNTNSV